MDDLQRAIKKVIKLRKELKMFQEYLNMEFAGIKCVLNYRQYNNERVIIDFFNVLENTIKVIGKDKEGDWVDWIPLKCLLDGSLGRSFE